MNSTAIIFQNIVDQCNSIKNIAQNATNSKQLTAAKMVLNSNVD